MSQEGPGPRDLYVRMALVEQALVHAEDKASMVQEMTDQRARAMERQIGVVVERTDWLHEGHLRHDRSLEDMTIRAGAAEQSLASLSERQSRNDKLAERLRYAMAGLLALLVAADRMAPETLKAAVKVLGLLPL